MGSVAQAVVEFDEAVQAPWRPPLAGAAGARGQLRVVPEPARRPGGAPVGEDVAPVAARSRGVRRATPPSRRAAPPSRRAVRPGGATVCRTPPVRTIRSRADVPAPGIRFTRRARRLGAVLGLAVGVVVGAWVGSAVGGGEDALRLAGESRVVVQQGDTLWSLAAAVAGDGDDVRAVIAEIREMNGLLDASLVPGQVLVLP